MPDRKRRVLVVDDDASIQGFLAEALADEGYGVRIAGNGREALSILQEWPPDLILLDLMMPEMDGWAFRAEQRRLNGQAADVPVIVLSAARDLMARTQDLAAARIFAKPFDLDALLTTIDDFTSQGGRPIAHA
ncbi:MAG: response regulator [Chloroflexi bacterium]|nr:response regulator [Chloroflexota bacterium]